MAKQFKYTIYKRPGTEMLYIRMLGKRYSTGLPDTPPGREAADYLAGQFYNKHLLEISGIEQGPVKISPRIKDLADIYLSTFANKQSIALKQQAFKRINYESNYILNRQNLFYYLDILKADTSLSENSKTMYLKAIKAFINYLVNREYIEQINLKTYKFDYSSERYKLFFTDEEMDKIYNSKYVKARPEFHYLLRFLQVSGFRISETLKMNWSDIDLDTGLIRVHNKVKQTRLQYFPISEEIIKILDLLAELKGSRTGTVFSIKRGTARIAFKNLLRKLNIYRTSLGFHGLRRSFTNKLINSDVPIEQASELLRHSDFNLTLKVYKQYEPDKLRASLNKVKF